MVFGIGAGSEASLSAMGLYPPYQPLNTIREMVHLLRRLFNGETVTYEGSFAKIHNGRLEPIPKPLPIIIGGRGPKILALMGEIGDGALLEVPPVALKQAKNMVEKGRKSSSCDASRFKWIQWLPAAVGADVTTYSDFTKWVTLFSITQTPDIINERVGFNPEKIQDLRSTMQTKGIGAALKAVTPDMIATYGLAGPVETVREKIHMIQAEGINQIVFHYPFGSTSPEKGIKLIAEAILPIFESTRGAP